MSILDDEITLPHRAMLARNTPNADFAQAIVEKQVAIATARRFPRDIERARKAVAYACAIPAVAQKAFYRRTLLDHDGIPFQASGASVYLAREIARSWTNVVWGTIELHRDSQRGGTHARAFAWDQEDNSEASATFFVPDRHRPEVGPSSGQRQPDNRGPIAKTGATFVREMIFQVLPYWYVDEAKALCLQTLEHGGGLSIEDRISKLVANYAGKNVDLGRLQLKVGRKKRDWDVHDVVQLDIIWSSLGRGECTIPVEFPLDTDSVRDMLGLPQGTVPASEIATVDDAPAAAEPETAAAS